MHTDNFKDTYKSFVSKRTKFNVAELSISAKTKLLES